jgi:hypothetical protein
MRFQNYINESAAKGGLQKYFKELKKMPAKKVEQTLKNSWKDLSNILKDRLLEDDAVKIINKHLKTNYKRLKEIDTAKIAKIPTKKVYEELMLNEDFAHFWQRVKDEAFPALSFYPALTAWLEIDKLLSGTGDFSGYKFGVYALFWVILISSKFLKDWKKWTKENPEEFETEGSKKNPFAI